MNRDAVKMAWNVTNHPI